MFTNKSHLPVRKKNPDQNIEKYRELAISLCDLYFKTLANVEKMRVAQQNQQGWVSSTFSTATTHFKPVAKVVKKYVGYKDESAKEILCAQAIKDYLNEYELPNKNDIADFVYQQFMDLPQKENDESAFNVLRVNLLHANILKELLGVDLEALQMNHSFVAL